MKDSVLLIIGAVDRDELGPRGGAARRKVLAWARGWVGGVALILLCLAVYLPGLGSLPTVDRDEARFAQASRQMADASSFGDWIVPRIQDRPRLNKPPAIYWLQAGSARAARALGLPDAIWVYRLPSLLAALIAVLATWRAGLILFDPRAAWLAAALLALCPLVVWESRQARADMALLAASTLAFWMLAIVLTTPGDRPVRTARLGLWLAVALGVFIKGPITPMVVLLAAGLLALAGGGRDTIRRLAPLPGLALVLLAIGVWIALVAQQVGWSTYLAILRNELLGRSLAPQEGHWGPPGYHVILLSILFWPGSMLTAAGIARAVRRGWPALQGRSPRRWWSALRRAEPGRASERLCLAWIVPSWLVFELVSTKLPHYTLPLYPAIALITARGVLAIAAGSGSPMGLGIRAGVLLWAVLGIALAATPSTLPWALGLPAESGVVWLGVALTLTCWVLVVAAARSAYGVGMPGLPHAGRRLIRAHTLALSAAVMLAVGLIFGVLPRIEGLWVTRQIASVLHRADPASLRPVAGVEYHEDSLIFETGGRFRRLSPGDVDAWLDAHPAGLIILPEEIADRRRDLQRLAQVVGLNYSKGTRVRLWICAHMNGSAP